MLGKDTDSVAGLNVPMNKYEDGEWGRSPTPGGGVPDGAYSREKVLDKYGVSKGASRKRRCIIAAIIIVIVFIIVVAVAVPVGLIFGKDGSSSSGSGSGSSGTSYNNYATSGTDGSTIVLANGTSVVYRNAFGGRWASGLSDDSAQAQNYTKPLSEEWDWANDKIFGVNLGGWLVTEPFIAPALYEPYANTSSPAVDEYTLSAKYLAEGGQANLEARMRSHYDTFITEADFMEIAAAGLNWVRLPIGFWAIETIAGETFLEGVSWEYVLKAIEWARKYGIRINLDFHAMPGGQNTYNHSGRLGYMSFLNGVMGLANAQRALNYVRILTEFISQPEIRKVVPMFSLLNEPNLYFGIGTEQLKSYYAESYYTVRNITGYGSDNGPMIAFHDGFAGLDNFNGFLTNSDRVAYDTHPYVAFGPTFTNSYDQQIAYVCNTFSQTTSNAFKQHGLYIAGEFSLAINDCGLYLNNVGQGARYEGDYPGLTTVYGSCSDFDDWTSYNASHIQSIHNFAIAQMSSLRNFFFWTWTIGDSIVTNATVNPAWNYKLGLQQGWIPSDLNAALSEPVCLDLASSITTSSINSASATTWSGTLSAWQTGAASSYPVTIAASNTWPPATLQTTTTQNQTIPASSLPQYTKTGTVYSLPAPTYTISQKSEATPTIGNWYNSGDTSPMWVAIAGCAMPSPYYNGTLPSGFPCPPGAGSAPSRRDVEFVAARATSAPRLYRR
jgi:glucan 1,3-beta-glucosidase